MASQTPTRPGHFLVGDGSPRLSLSTTGERYPVPQEAPSPAPARKKVVFSSENLRYNKMMLKQARERNKVNGGSSRARDKSRSPRKQTQGIAIPPIGIGRVALAEPEDTQPRRPSKSPAPVAFRPEACVEIRGGLTTARSEVEPRPYSTTSTGKKRSLDAPAELFPAAKRRLLEHFSRSPSPRVLHRQYEHTALVNSEDELGEIDELGEPNPTSIRRLMPPPPSPTVTKKAAKQDALASQKEVPRKRRALSVWRLASPPKVSIVQVSKPEVADSGRNDASDQSSDGGGGSEEDCHIWGEKKRRPKRAQDKLEDENRGKQQQGGRETAASVSIISGGVGGETNSVENVNDEAAKPSEDTPITLCGERHYSEWTGTWNGEARRIPGAGALFPEGYEPLISNPEPWICPIRDCQTVFPEAWALGGHFNATHRALLLNDNRDGTMSILGKRKFSDPSTGRMPALVISRQPIDPETAPPKAPPRQPGRRSKKTEQKVPDPKPANTPGRRPGTFLVVDLPSNRSFKHFHAPDTSSGAITSDKQTLPVPSSGTSSSQDGVPDSSSSDESISVVPSRRSTKVEGLSVSSRAARTQMRQQALPTTTPQASVDITASARRSGRLTKQQTEPVRKRPAWNVSQPEHSARKQSVLTTSKSFKAKSAPVHKSPRRPEGDDVLPFVKPSSSSSSVSSSSSYSSSLWARVAIPPHTMSDWEIAPGRIRVGTGDKSDNVAFSSTYLAHSSTCALPLTPTISFQLLTIQPGSTVHWGPADSAQEEEPRTRVCSVARGIVKVKLCGQEFDMGPNGMFKVPTGQRCELGSVWYGGAVVHVTCISEGDE
ncbi:hypothetical protein QBC41DRAFT_252909 [Cercophora samala]|uniref:Uncharacterized protein n=1 Tax=Cercophora samala TaxID=330535 RepID=A0AA40DBM3_9PEZI|nr:hypothetical protein QBC41DRAFT_252909 [Cercophora samala]